MDKRAMGRIHEADDAVVNWAVQDRRNVNPPIGRRRQRERQDVGNGLVGLLGVGDEHPHIAVTFTARVGGESDLLRLNRRILDQRWNSSASAARIELPAMVSTFDAVSLHSSKRKWHAAVWADIAQSRDFAFGGPTNHDRET